MVHVEMKHEFKSTPITSVELPWMMENFYILEDVKR